MNAHPRLFLIGRHSRLAARLFACAASCAVLGGCVGNPLERAKVDPRSPIAAEVSRIDHAPAAFPKFSDIPAVPKDIRPKPQFGQAARQIEMAATEIERATAPDTWTLKETGSFTSAGQAAVGPERPAADPAATEAFAKDLRKRATPPPPPKR